MKSCEEVRVCLRLSVPRGSGGGGHVQCPMSKRCRVLFCSIRPFVSFRELQPSALVCMETEVRVFDCRAIGSNLKIKPHYYLVIVWTSESPLGITGHESLKGTKSESKELTINYPNARIAKTIFFTISLFHLLGFCEASDGQTQQRNDLIEKQEEKRRSEIEFRMTGNGKTSKIRRLGCVTPPSALARFTQPSPGAYSRSVCIVRRRGYAGCGASDIVEQKMGLRRAPLSSARRMSQQSNA